MLDLISIGTVTIDLYYIGDSLTQDHDNFQLAIGGKYFASHFFESLGGGGANVSIGVTKLGLKAGLVAKIGNNPFKPIILDKLDTAQVHHKDLCHIEDGYTNISSVLLSKSGEKTLINYRTHQKNIFPEKENMEILLKAQAVYMASLANVSLTERIDTLRYAKRYARRTFANLNVTDCRRPVEEILHFLDPVDIFIINTHEFADIVKTAYESIDFHHDVTSKFSPFRKDKILVLTDGKKGSYAYFEGKVHHQPAIKHVDVVDSTGAGDGYTAGFIAEYLKTKDIKGSMLAGAEYSVKILRKMGSN